jgi:hypothetical protein
VILIAAQDGGHFRSRDRRMKQNTCPAFPKHITAQIKAACTLG